MTADMQDARDFLEACSEAFLGRPPLAGEIEGLSGLLASSRGYAEVVRRYSASDEFRGRVGTEFVPAGHFYSVVPSAEERARYLGSGRQPEDPSLLPGVDLCLENQEAHLQAVMGVSSAVFHGPEKRTGLRYWFENPSYSYGDALSLMAMLARLSPQRVVEVGSGFSSALMLDYAEQRLDRPVRFSFIEPYPDLLRSLLLDGDEQRISIIAEPVQRIPIETFLALEANDILFIDSTHCSKLGSDVNQLYLDVLPRLAPGVMVHVHDIFWPFEYPRHWIEEGRAWNEAYLLRALLIGSSIFRVEFMSDFMYGRSHGRLAAEAPLVLRNTGGHLWMRRI